MSRALGELRGLVREFLASRLPFREFHEGFIDRWTRLDRDALPGGERAAWNEVYGWVLTAIPDPVDGADRGRGVIGEAELRQRLANWKAPDPAP